jgi:hypothetical protein
VKPENKTIQQALIDIGITPSEMAAHIRECLEAKAIKFDGVGGQVEVKDLALKLKTLQFLADIFGKKAGDRPPGAGAEELFEDTPLE